MKPHSFRFRRILSTDVPPSALDDDSSLLRRFSVQHFSVAVFAAVSLLGSPSSIRAEGERRFGSPEEAVKALVAAAEARDTNTLHAIFGPAGRELVSPDVIQASAEREIFLQRLKTGTDLVKTSDAKAELEIGADNWPFPVPLVKDGSQWYFDTAAGGEEILNRRIGRNEIGAIQVCHAYVQAQREYASREHGVDGVVEYSQFLRSVPGAQNGLYWPAKEGEALSPLGPLIAQAHFEGYHGKTGTKAMSDDQSTPYHGYFFKVLTCQGRHAPGGKYKYIINGHMVAGFALVAWPEEWGNSGVMTFMVNQSGNIYQKSLGPKTSSLAPRISCFDPDSSWSPTKEE